MKKSKQYNVFAPQIINGASLRERVHAISKSTGKKIYQIAKEAMEIGLSQIEESK